VAFSLSVTRPFLAVAVDNPDGAAPAPTLNSAAAPAAAMEGSPTETGQPMENVTVTARRLNEARASIQTQTGASTYTIDSQTIQAMPGGDNTLLNQVILQAPGVAQDSFGQLHVRGEHNGLQYRLNGIILPEGISVFGQSLDPRLIQSMQLITGALPAQYGLRTAGIVDLTTKSGLLEPFGDISIYGGSHGEVQPSFFYGGSAGKLSYFVTGDFLRNDLGIESPDGSSNPLHDHTKQYHGFGYFEYLLGADDRLSAVVGTSHGEFQIPNQVGLTPDLGYTVDGQSDYPSAQLNENQTEITQYGIASWQHSHGGFDLQSSLSWRYSSLTFFPDPLGDLLFNGISQNAYKRDVAYGWQTDAAIHLGSAHTLRLGFYLQHDTATSDTRSAVLPVDASGAQTGGPITVVNNSMQVQNIGSLYLQDEWQLLSDLTLNYGLRFDHLSAYTSGHQLSPRLNAVWKPMDGMTVHGGYSRYFSPPPFELVGLSSIEQFSGTSAQPAVQQADPPLPESANYYDVGIEQALGHFTVGLDTYYKQSRNLIDEGQFGAPIILTPFNYRYGLQYGAELTLSYSLDGFSAYANLGTTRARGKDIISAQFNFQPDELSYIADHYISLDHEQQYTASAGASYQWQGTRISTDMIFGSGLRANLALPDGMNIPNGTHLPYYHQVNLGLSHTFHWWGSDTRPGPTVRFDVINLFDSVYQIRNGTGVGVGAPQYGPRRGFFVGLSAPL
jgi:outer membrane receptor protein involved in Fe transport